MKVNSLSFQAAVLVGLSASAAIASPLYYEAASAFVSKIAAAQAAVASASTAPLRVDIAKIRAGDNSNFLYYNCQNKGQFAITFDDGPQYNHDAIRKLLDKYNAKGTFFVNGNNWACIYADGISEALQGSYRAGHQIASHTWSHPDIAKLTAAQLNTQLNWLEGALGKILGVKPAMFRPPFGSYNNEALATIAQRNYSAVVMWNGISGASTSTSVSQSLSWYSGNAKSYPDPHIVLNHEQDGDALTQIYEPVFKELTQAGYKLVTVAECLNLPAYQSVGTLGTRDSSWTCNGTPGPGQYS